MPCFFFNNLPKVVFNHTWFEFSPEKVSTLRQAIASVDGLPPEQIEFHLVKSEYRLLTDEARLIDHGVHIEVDWHAGRSSKTKMAISQVLFEFMKFYGFEEGLDITFRDSPAESFFVEEGGQIISVS